MSWNTVCSCGSGIFFFFFFFYLIWKFIRGSVLSGLRTSNMLSNAHQPSKPLSYSSNQETWSPLCSIRYHIGMFSWWYHVLIQPGEEEVATIPRLMWHIYGNISPNSKSYISKVILVIFLWYQRSQTCQDTPPKSKWQISALLLINKNGLVMSNSLQPHELKHARLPCPSPSPRDCPSSSSLSWWCRPAISSSVIPFSSCLQSFPASGSLPVELALHIRWPKYWSFIFSISPYNEYSGLISLRIDCFDLFAVQGTLKSLLQHHSSKASILRCSAFFTVQLSHPYMITGKPIALTRWTFAGKVMSLLFNTLSRFVIDFLPRSKNLLISWLQSPSPVIL